jgi:hypothetical protein
MMLAAITMVVLVAADVPAMARVDQAAQRAAYQAQEEERNAQQTVDQAVYQARNAERDATQAKENGGEGKRKGSKKEKTERNMPEIDGSAVSDAALLALGSSVLLVPSMRRNS